MQVKLTLDPNIDKKLIDELKKRANGGPLSKALYLFTYELFFSRPCLGPIQDQIGPIQDPIGPEDASVGPDALAGALADIEEEW